MNQIIIILLFLFVFNQFSCTSQPSNIKVRVDNIVKLESEENKKVSLYSADINLVNNSDNVVRFWIMSCAWPINFVYSNDLIGLSLGYDCDSNYPDDIALKPRQEKTYKGTIVKIKGSKNKIANNFKIGFIFIKGEEVDNYGFTFRKVFDAKISKRQDIIWSDSFELK